MLDYKLSNFSGIVHQEFPEDVKQYVRDRNVWAMLEGMMEDEETAQKVDAFFANYPLFFWRKFGIYQRVLGNLYPKMVEGYSYEQFLTELVYLCGTFLYERDEKKPIPTEEMNLEIMAAVTMTIRLNVMEAVITNILKKMTEDLPLGTYMVLDDVWNWYEKEHWGNSPLLLAESLMSEISSVTLL